MRLRSRFVAAVALIAVPLVSQAGNPHIIINSDPPNPIVLVSQAFELSANALGGGYFVFQNESGVSWEELTVKATLPNDTTITCGPGPFVTCTIGSSPSGNESLYTLVFGPTAAGGITSGQIFTVDLNDSGTDPNGAGSWGEGNQVKALANDPAVVGTPEPSALALAFCGLLAVGGLQKLQRRASKVEAN